MNGATKVTITISKNFLWLFTCSFSLHVLP